MADPIPTTEALPSPESDILKSRLFMRFSVSGGPHMDALLYNQGTIMRLIQDIRLIQSRNIGTGTGIAGGMAATAQGDQGDDQQSTPAFAQVCKDLVSKKEESSFLVGIMKKWMANEPKNNKLAGNRRNQRLGTWAASWWVFCKNSLVAYWDREDDQWDERDRDEMFYKDLIAALKIIDQSGVEVEELYLGICKKTVDKAPPTGSKRTRVSGGAQASTQGPSNPSSPRSQSGSDTRGVDPSAINIDSDDDEPVVKRTRRINTTFGGDATMEVKFKTEGLAYDDLFDADEEKNEYKQATIIRRKKDMLRNVVYQQAKVSGVWDQMDNVVEEEDEEEATRARLAQLLMD